MKGQFSKLMGVLAGAVAFFGISATNIIPSVPDISENSALYLEHGNFIDGNSGLLAWHSSHASHASHSSHASHASHVSGS